MITNKGVRILCKISAYDYIFTICINMTLNCGSLNQFFLYTGTTNTSCTTHRLFKYFNFNRLSPRILDDENVQIPFLFVYNHENS